MSTEIVQNTVDEIPDAGQPSPDTVESPETRSFWRDTLIGVATQSWLASMVFHMTLMVVLALVLGTIHVTTIGQAPEFEAAEQDASAQPEITHFEVGYTPLAPSELSTETLMLTEAPSVEAQFNDHSPVFEEAGGGTAGGNSALGGLGGFNVTSSGLGPLIKGAGGVDAGAGFGKNIGAGGAGEGFGSRGTGMREAMLGTGGTKQSERAVAAALNWLARHQSTDGHWSIQHTAACKGGRCPGPGNHESDCAGTAMGLLPFLAAGQTHETKGPYQQNILRGINWLIKHQRPTGDLKAGPGSQMYSHGLATIALCEAYGMTQDQRVGYAAQAAISFIESGQNREGGWRYTHGTDDSDTSVFGWQVMALKSGQMAGLKVNPKALDNCRHYLQLCARGKYKSEFTYSPLYSNHSYTMTSVGLLASQYLGARRDDPVIVNGLEYLLTNKPDIKQRNTYYWYYATQVMHNCPGPQWDEWNRNMRRILIETQETKGCAAGSWDPEKPEPDPWGSQGGRLMVTSFSALTLEVYYRYLPLYKLDETEKDLKKLD
jgi:Squalene-hopene cyclase C-terminal domain